jgi:hypothetical protein
LLVGPVFAILISAAALGGGQLRIDTPLARWTAGLVVVMAVQIFNPTQGGIAVGVAGIIFMMAPLFWYWVGRAYATPELMSHLLFRVVLPFGLAATAFGFYQRFVGYLPYQMEWYQVAGYLGLGNPETGLAPISFFASGTEHGAFLVTAGVVIWAVALKSSRAAILLLLPVIVAIVLTGSRGPVVKILVIMAVMWAVIGTDRRSWVPRFALAVVLLGAGLVWSLNKTATMSLDPAVQRSLERQSEVFGGEGPEAGQSTVTMHSRLLKESYGTAFRRPLGFGLGATSAAAAKFGGPSTISLSTETDVGDVMVATGLVGGLIYHVMIVLVAMAAIRYWRGTRTMLALALLGLPAAHFLLWLGGGLYAVSAIVWICIGGVDRLERDRALAQQVPQYPPR